MADRARRPKQATYADVEIQPPHVVAELVDGALYTFPRPRSRHALAAMRLGRQVSDGFDDARRGPDAWWILMEPELHLRDDVVVPDLAGWRRERMPEFPDVPWFDLAPDWVCEVLSPSTESHDRGLKLAIYARAGVPYAWLVDPQAGTLEALRREGESWLPLGVHDGTAPAHVPPFLDLALDLESLRASSALRPGP